MPLAPGQIIAQRYKVVRVLGHGGFGAVYLAQDVRLTERVVALKECFDDSPEAKTQFALEAGILATVQHRALPRVSDSFEANGHDCLVMDFIEGQDLSTLIERGALSETQAINWMSEICDAVGFLHSLNPPIIHRDIKPANIKIRSDGRAMLVDFGIAKVYNPQKRTVRVAQAISSGFSPPEQYGAGTNARSDVYALGATLYAAVTRSVPPEALDLLNGNAQLIPPHQLNPRIKPALEQVILTALCLDPQQRFADGRTMAQQLQMCLHGPVASQPVPPPLVGARCPECGQPNRPGAKFCQFDGTRLAAAARLMALSPQMRFEAGNTHAQKKNFQSAVVEYDAAARSGFDHPALYHNWANVLIEMERPQEAIPLLRGALGRYPQDADLYAQLGWAYTISKQHIQAAQMLQHAVALNPRPETHLILGLVYQKMQDAPRAIAALQYYLNSGEESAFARVLLAQAWLHLGELARATAECHRALQLDSKNVDAYTLLAAIHLRNKKYNDAIKAARQAIQIEPKASAYYFLGRAYMGLKKWNDALKALDESAQLDPDDVDPYFQMAQCYLELKRRAEAREALEQILQIDPNNSTVREKLKGI